MNYNIFVLRGLENYNIGVRMKALKIKSVECFGVNWISFGGGSVSQLREYSSLKKIEMTLKFMFCHIRSQKYFSQSYQARPLLLRHFSGRNNWCIIIPLKLEAAFFSTSLFLCQSSSQKYRWWFKTAKQLLNFSWLQLFVALPWTQYTKMLFQIAQNWNI